MLGRCDTEATVFIGDDTTDELFGQKEVWDVNYSRSHVFEFSSFVPALGGEDLFVSSLPSFEIEFGRRTMTPRHAGGSPQTPASHNRDRSRSPRSELPKGNALYNTEKISNNLFSLL